MCECAVGVWWWELDAVGEALLGAECEVKRSAWVRDSLQSDNVGSLVAAGTVQFTQCTREGGSMCGSVLPALRGVRVCLGVVLLSSV
jgi:hypothetical protein